MPDARSKLVVEAHALRAATAEAALLHGSRRSPQERRRPLAALIMSLVVALLLIVAVWATNKIGDLISQQRSRNHAAVWHYFPGVVPSKCAGVVASRAVRSR